MGPGPGRLVCRLVSRRVERGPQPRRGGGHRAHVQNVVKDERDPGVTALVGYRFNPHFAAEVGFAWLGEFQMTNQVTAPAVGALNADIRAIGLFIDAVGLLPLGADFDALAKVGAVTAETRTFRSTSGTVTPAPNSLTNATKDEVVLKVGLGFQYNFAKSVTLRAEWDRYLKVGDGNTGQFDIDLYSFVDKGRPQRLATGRGAAPCRRSRARA